MEVIIVLCRAETSLNVGAVCRVMANCDLSKLRIVGDKNIYNETEVLTLALHARSIWDNAEFFPASIEGLKDATKDCTAVFATTRRTGAKRKYLGLSPQNFVQLSYKENYEKVALVFGNERTGLTDEEVASCSHSINIPSCTSYPSYNLSHAVLILAYTLFTYKDSTILCDESPLIKWKDKTIKKRHTITFAKSCETANNIVYKLKQMGLYKKGGEKDSKAFLSQMLLRSRLSEEECEFFLNIFNKLFYKNAKRNLKKS